MARSKHSSIEISISGLLDQREAEAWIEDHMSVIKGYTDDETPWSINETVKMHPMSGLWMASIKANRG